jgi:hypothetical protein
MLYLYLLNETFTNGFNHALSTLVSLLSAINGIVIISKNTIVSVVNVFITLLTSLPLLLWIWHIWGKFILKKKNKYIYI